MTHEKPHHPALVFYGQNTISEDFPLVLVIGREPQVDEIIVPGAGRYDFLAHPRCAFWNVAYRVLARSSGQPGFGTAALKRECVVRAASPLVVADALPLGLSNQNDGPTKHLERAAVSRETIGAHIDGILQLELTRRVRLVILSGHQFEHFQHATNIFKRLLGQDGIPFIDTAFFYPTNCRKIDEQIGQAGGWPVLREVLDAFLGHAAAGVSSSGAFSRATAVPT